MIPLEMLYFGVVEDVMDPLEMGRLRVRIFGVHSHIKTELPTDKLPWANVFMPVPHPFISGIGLSPTGMVPGATVALIPKDPEFLQEWFILFTTGGMQQRQSNPAFGFIDPDGLYPLSSTNHDVNVAVRGTIDSKGIPMGAASDKNRNRTVTTVEKIYDKGDGKGAVDPNPEDKEAVQATQTAANTASAPWMSFVEKELGINEDANAARVKEYHTIGGGSSKWGGEVPWCASFVGWSLAQAKLKGSGSALARSYVPYGNTVKDSDFPYGAIIVVAGSRGPSSGHVCFVTGVSGNNVNVIGGNQSAKSKDNGGEVSRSSFPKSKILAVRWPVIPK